MSKNQKGNVQDNVFIVTREREICKRKTKIWEEKGIFPDNPLIFSDECGIMKEEFLCIFGSKV